MATNTMNTFDSPTYDLGPFRKKKTTTNPGAPTTGFGANDMVENAPMAGQNGGMPSQAGMPIAAPQMGLGEAGSNPLLSSPPPAPASAPRATPLYQGNDSDFGSQPAMTGFGSGYPNPLPDLHSEAQSRWQGRGIDFDGLLRGGIAKSMQDESRGEDMWSRMRAMELNRGYIDAANARMQPQVAQRNQDVEVLQQLIMGRNYATSPQDQARFDAGINQLMMKLGLAGLSPATGLGGQGQQQGQQSVQSQGDTGLGSKMQAFMAGAAPTAGFAGGAALAKNLAGKAAGNVVGRSLGGVLGSAGGPLGTLAGGVAGGYAANKLLDLVMPGNDAAQQANPGTFALGGLLGLGAPSVGKKVMDRFRPQTGAMSTTPPASANQPAQPQPQASGSGIPTRFGTPVPVPPTAAPMGLPVHVPGQGMSPTLGSQNWQAGGGSPVTGLGPTASSINPLTQGQSRLVPESHRLPAPTPMSGTPATKTKKPRKKATVTSTTTP